MPTDLTRTQAVFVAAAEIADPADRAAFLADACGDDLHLKSRVEALLRAHDGADSLLDAPLVAPPDPDDAPTDSFSPDKNTAVTRTTGGDTSDDDESLAFLSPTSRPDSLGRIGHYEVLQVLGKGGFGIVFRAFDDVLQRVVAVKVMTPQLAATSPARKRFLREARTSAAVRHENVVQVYEVGETPLPNLVMEFIPGETLQQRLDRIGPVEPAEVVRIGRQIAEGLAAAHATDLIHRDIKPGNILLEGGHQKVKITDFGLARAADDASISQSGIIAGTPMYMAPEQALGEKLDHRADLFSLGSVLYQMAAGRPPFRANNTVAVLKRVAEDTPRSIREIIPETPQWLCDIIAKLHAKDPDDRYQSAREVADVLADCEAQLKASSKLKDYSRIPRGKPQRSGRRKWVAAALVLVALVGVGVYALTRPQPNSAGPGTEPPRSTAVAWGEVTDPLGDCRLTEENDRLTIAVPGDRLHDFNPLPGRNLNAPRVLREVAGDFEARVTVLPSPRPTSQESTGPNPPYVGAGLVVWSDEAGILRLFRAYSGGSFVHAEWYNSLAPGGSKCVPAPDGPQHLRIRRTGTTLRLASSTDGQMWTEVAVVTNLRRASRVRVGVAVVNAIKQEFTVQFEGFEIKELPPGSLTPTFTNSIGMELRFIPPGKFTMGSSPQEIERALSFFSTDDWAKARIPTEGPAHDVEITQPFYLGVTEVTVGQFRQFVEETKYNVGDGYGEQLLKMARLFDDYPVVYVTWHNAVAFCDWLSKKEGKHYRLPTEAEWEYSCRAGKDTRYCFGGDDAELEDYCWYSKNSGGGTKLVGTKKPNDWGLYDMHGNVWEWCQDNYDGNYYTTSPRQDPTGPGSGGERVLRGGSWYNAAVFCRSAFRDHFDPNDRHNRVGFRVVLVSPPAGTESGPKIGPAGLAPAGAVPPGAVLVMNFEKDTFFEKDGKTWVRDLSGRGNDGVCEDVSFTPDGKVGGGLACQGGALRIPHSLINGQANYTITGWYWSDATKSGPRSLYWSAVSERPEPVFSVLVTPERSFFVHAWNKDYDPHNWLGAATKVEVVPNQGWNFFAVTMRDGGVGSGTLRVTVNETTYPLNTQMVKTHDGISVSDFVGPGNKASGTVIDELAVFQRALSDDESRALRELGRNNVPLLRAPAVSPLPAAAPFTDADVKRIAALPAPQQIEEVRKELMRLNPGFDGEVRNLIEDDVVTQITIVSDKVIDITPIRVWSTLKRLDCTGTSPDKPNGQLADLTPLAGMKLADLRFLNLNDTKVSDAGMAVFKDCKNLEGLRVSNTQVGDAGLAHFKDCKALRFLSLTGTKATDAGLIHFKDRKYLTKLHLGGTKVSDAGLAYFKGMPLKVLWIQDTGITDLTALQGMPLEDIRLTPKNITKGLATLHAVKSLKTIGTNWDQTWPAAEFWDRYEKGEFK